MTRKQAMARAWWRTAMREGLQRQEADRWLSCQCGYGCPPGYGCCQRDDEEKERMPSMYRWARREGR